MNADECGWTRMNERDEWGWMRMNEDELRWAWWMGWIEMSVMNGWAWWMRMNLMSLMNADEWTPMNGWTWWTRMNERDERDEWGCDVRNPRPRWMERARQMIWPRERGSPERRNRTLELKCILLRKNPNPLEWIIRPKPNRNFLRVRNFENQGVKVLRK